MRPGLFIVGLLAGWSAICCPAQEPRVRTSLATPGDVWVGQRIVVAVEMLAPGYFAGSPSFELPSTPGLVLVPPSTHPVVSTEVIDGTSYTVQRHEMSAFARRGGTQTIPAFSVRFQFKRNPLDPQSVKTDITTEPLAFTAKVPPGAEKLGGLISARNLRVEEAWKPEPGKAKVGDAFTRTVTYSAPGVPGMAFPPFLVGPIDGLGIYPKPPEVVDQSERGELTGTRCETIVYVCKRSGRFVIPAAQMTWFDLEAQKLQTIELPSRIVEVASAVTERVPEKVAFPWKIVVGLVALTLVVWSNYRRLFWLLVPLKPRHLQPLNPIQRNTERFI